MIIEHRELIIFLMGLLLGFLMRNKKAKGYEVTNLYKLKDHQSILDK